MKRCAETDLYYPVKTYLEGLGYEVKSEIGAADVLAVRPGEDPVIIELKSSFSLTLLQQGIARQAITDAVYVAVPKWRGKAGWRAFKGNIALCRRLGLGVISVADDRTLQVHCDPGSFKPRKSKVKRDALLKEFARRQGDPNKGGTSGKIMTAYRQEALRCAIFLGQEGASKGAVVAKATEVRRATTIMRDNHYGWFQKVTKGVYQLSEAGVAALDVKSSALGDELSHDAND